MQMKTEVGSVIAVAELQPIKSDSFAFGRDKVQKGDLGTVDGSGLCRDAQVVERATMLLAQVAKRCRIGPDNSCLFPKDADCDSNSYGNPPETHKGHLCIPKACRVGH